MKKQKQKHSSLLVSTLSLSFRDLELALSPNLPLYTSTFTPSSNPSPQAVSVS